VIDAYDVKVKSNSDIHFRSLPVCQVVNAASIQRMNTCRGGGGRVLGVRLGRFGYRTVASRRNAALSDLLLVMNPAIEWR
jgi:hypothetical protein